MNTIAAGVPALQIAFFEYAKDYLFRSTMELILSICLIIIIPASIVLLSGYYRKQSKAHGRQGWIQLLPLLPIVMSLTAGIYLGWNRQNHTIQFNKYIQAYVEATESKLREYKDLNDSIIREVETINDQLSRLASGSK